MPRGDDAERWALYHVVSSSARGCEKSGLDASFHRICQFAQAMRGTLKRIHYVRVIQPVVRMSEEISESGHFHEFIGEFLVDNPVLRKNLKALPVGRRFSVALIRNSSFGQIDRRLRGKIRIAFYGPSKRKVALNFHAGPILIALQ